MVLPPNSQISTVESTPNLTVQYWNLYESKICINGRQSADACYGLCTNNRQLKSARKLRIDAIIACSCIN